MKINYTGRKVELAPAQLRKIEALFGKLAKLLDGKGQREAHVVLSQERRQNRAEITVNYQHHSLVGIDSNADLFTAIHGAIQKLEKQAIKVLAKRRDIKRAPRKEMAALAPPSEPAEREARRQVFRLNNRQNGKPMTLDEALLEMEQGRDYLVYRDAQSDRISLLVRRRDGHFDLIEA